MRNSILPALLIALAILSGASAQEVALPPRAEKNYAPFPQPGPGYVTDHAHVISSQDMTRLQRLLWDVEEKTGVEIVVVTIRSIGDYPGSPNGSIEPFATGLFNAWGIGNMPKNNGVLLLVAIADRKVRIETGAGYGRTMDAASQRIIDRDILPQFRKDRYSEGIVAGTRSIASKFAGVRFVDWRQVAIIAVAIVLLTLITVSLFRNGKRGWGWVCTGFIIVLLLALLYLIFQIFRALPRGYDGDSWGGSSSGGSGGGFGGGSSGGGGATGGW